MDNDFEFFLSDDFHGNVEESAREWLKSRLHSKIQHHDRAAAATAEDVCARDPSTGKMLHDMDTVLKFNAIRCVVGGGWWE